MEDASGDRASLENKLMQADLEDYTNRVDGLAWSEANTPQEEVVKDTVAEVRVPPPDPDATPQRAAGTSDTKKGIIKKGQRGQEKHHKG